MTDLNPITSPVSGVRNTGLSRRGFLRGVGATGAAAAGASLLAACGGDEEGGDTTDDGGNDEKILNFANWPLYIDTKRVDGKKTYPTLDGVRAGDRHPGQLHRAGQRQRGVLRQDPADPGRQQGRRRRLVRAHRLDGHQVDQPDLARGDGQGEHPELRQPHLGAEGADVRPEPRLLAAVAVRRDRHRLRLQRDRRGRARSPTCSPTPTSTARSPCSRRCGTRWA